MTAAEADDPMLKAAVEVVIDAGQASTSLLQRRCKLGYARAARIMDEMEQKGIIGPYEGAKPRAVFDQPPAVAGNVHESARQTAISEEDYEQYDHGRVSGIHRIPAHLPGGYGKAGLGPAGLCGGGRRRLCGPPQLWHRHHQPPAWKPRATGWAFWPSPGTPTARTSSGSANPNTVSSSAAAMWTAWSATTRWPRSPGPRMSTPPAARPGGRPDPQRHRLHPAGQGGLPRPAGDPGEAWRPPCGGSPITTTGWTLSCPASPRIRGPT